jgi:orotidine 5''-phosphate decarboxylase, subfamily 2
MPHFADRLFKAVEEKRSHVVVGLDPDYSLLPPALRDKHEALAYDDEMQTRVEACREFLFRLLTELRSEAVAVKPQLAFYEALGSQGYRLYEEVVAAAHSLGYLVIADAKRGDIGSSAEAYAAAHLDVAGADAVTVNPWFGSDGLEPFLRHARGEGKGVFVLVKTSNPGSADLQEQVLASGRRVYERVADLVRGWAVSSVGESGYANVGAVVGATYPAQAAGLRSALPGVPFLVPGYGAQGATAADVAGAFDTAGSGAVVNSSRAILYAYRVRPGHWAEAARAEAAAMRAALWQAAGRE